MLVKLLEREYKRAMNLRSIGIWTLMSAMCVYFFFNSAGWHKLESENQLDFMSLFIPQLIFGAWAALTVFYDLMSADREHNVLDLLLTSGITKNVVFLSKVLAAGVIALLLTLLYLLPITAIIVGMTGKFIYVGAFFRYVLPLWGYIMVHASLGFLISVLARSSKISLIWSIAAGLFLMPRFYVMLLEGIGSLMHLPVNVLDALSLLSPGVLMNALADPANTAKFTQALIGFALGSLGALIITYQVFIRQDELNYGE
jgi:ABC-type transport system involved in multi-copper enzyme maturation permease subunit